jgi:hypothetical protein
MKMHYNRFTDMGCFTIRGDIGPREWKMLQLGFNAYFKDLEEMMVINLTHATMTPEVMAEMIAFKKSFPNMTQQKVLIVSKEKGLGDFPKFEILLTRFQGPKIRQICRRIALEDEVFLIEQEIEAFDQKIKDLGYDESSAKKEIQKNIMIKTLSRAMEAQIRSFQSHEKNMTAVPTEIEDYDLKVKSALEDIIKALNKEVDL